MIYGLLTRLKNFLQHHFASEKKRKISTAVKESLLESLLQIIFNPEIYGFCDKYEFLCSRFSFVATLLNLIVNLKDWSLVLSA